MPTAKKRLDELDVFRGIAALFVVLYHYTYRYRDNVLDGIINPSFSIKYGNFGVELFFIISGFVIFLTVKKVKSGTEFIYKRFFRLYPTFWICMLITFAITSIGSIHRFKRSWSDLLYNIPMVPSLLGKPAIDGVYWSLQPELLFYVFILAIFYLKGLKKIEIIGYGWLTISLALYIFNSFYKHPVLSFLIIILNVNFSFLFLAGINFYKIWLSKDVKFTEVLKNHLQLFFCLLLCFLIKPLDEFVITFVFFILFYLFVYNKLHFLGKIAPLRFLGIISYSLYLLHQFIGIIIIKKLFEVGIRNNFILLIAPVLVCIFLSWMITYYFEKRLLPVFQKKTVFHLEPLKTIN